MIFDHQKPQAFLNAFRKAKNADLALYAEELFLAGRLLPESYDEVAALLRKIPKDVHVAYESQHKLIAPDAYTHYDKHLLVVLALGKISKELKLGRMMRLLGYNGIVLHKEVAAADAAPKIAQKKASPLFKKAAYLTRFQEIEELQTNCLEDFSAEISQLKSLKTLRIEAWGGKLEFDFSALPQLEQLYLLGDFAQALPPSISSLKNLHTLSIKGGDKLLSAMELPDWLGDLPQLRRLELMYHSAAKLEETIFAPTLEKIVLFRMPQLIHFPAALPRCSALRVISTAHCPNLQLSPAVAALEEK